MKKIILRLTGIILFNGFLLAAMAQKELYEIRVYTLKTQAQVIATDKFLKEAYLPALHRQDMQHIGIFKPIANDTAAVKKIYVLANYKSLDAWRDSKTKLEKDPVFNSTGKNFLDADTADLPFIRVESTLLEAFPDQPKLIPTPLKSNPDAVYELRSYESPTKVLHQTKVNMFNAGGEINLFKRLDFQAVFYADVISGSRMPNLVYMIVFPSITSRDAHWKAFGDSPEWKNISTDPKYRNNISVNHIDSYLMHRTDYSDL